MYIARMLLKTESLEAAKVHRFRQHPIFVRPRRDFQRCSDVTDEEEPHFHFVSTGMCALCRSMDVEREGWQSIPPSASSERHVIFGQSNHNQRIRSIETID